MRSALLLTAAAAAALHTGCSSAPTTGDDPEDSVAVDDGKEDNFLSESAQEYILEGQSTVTLDADMADKTADERVAAAKKLIEYKQIGIAWFLTAYLVDKDEEDANHEFGGFGGMAKGGEWTDLAVTERADHLTYDFTFKQIAAGAKNMLSKLPIHIVDGKQQFDLEIGKPTNDEMTHLVTNEEWYRNAPWNDWDPSKVPADQKETMTFTATKDTTSADAFFDLARLTEDGKLDIDIYFGWDYHSNYHLKHSKEFFTFLKDEGFTPPVATWDDLNVRSAAFTRQLTAGGKTIDIEVRLYFGKPGTVTDPDTDAGGKVLEAAARESLKTRDVVLYSGHSGPFYGFALANWNKTDEGDLDDSEMRKIDLADKYQVILAEACDTYQIGEAFNENPHKNGKNVDIVTTTSFSNAETPVTVEDFFHALLAHDSQERLRPQPISTLLTKMDSESADNGFHTMYGIHGIDQDPTLVPFANTAAIGTTCSVNSDCGGPGNLCVKMGSLGRRCTAACTADSACPTDYTCRSVASTSTSTIYGKACARSH